MHDFDVNSAEGVRETGVGKDAERHRAERVRLWKVFRFWRSGRLAVVEGSTPMRGAFGSRADSMGPTTEVGV